MKFTEATVVKFRMPPGKAEHIEFDDTMPGFGLRIRAGGRKEHRTFILQYKIGAKHRRLTLGNVAKIDLAEARKTAREHFGKIARGKDPANEKAAARSEAGQTFGLIAADYLDVQRGRLKPRSFDGAQRYLSKHWKPLHKLALASIDRAIVAAQLRLVAKDSGPVAADRARGTLSAFFAWAIGEGLCDLNPVVGTNKAVTDETTRDRVLTDAELAAIWNASPRTDYGNIVRLLMLTGCRRIEIGSLRWSEVDLKAAVFALPAERTKNARAHVVPLSRASAAVLEAIPRRADRDLVFGGGTGGFSGWSRAKARLDRAAKIAPWTLHDLRRTAATRMADSGVQPHIIEAVLNHISGHKGGVAGIYNRAAYEPEKRAALDTLASYIKTAVAQADGANVHKLAARRRPI